MDRLYTLWIDMRHYSTADILLLVFKKGKIHMPDIMQSILYKYYILIINKQYFVLVVEKNAVTTWLLLGAALLEWHLPEK